MYRILGRFNDAHTHLESVIERMRDAGNHMLLTVAINDLVQVYSAIGQTARAHQTLATHVHPLPDKARGNQRMAQAYLLAAEGKPAADAFRTLLADIPNDGLMDYYLLRFTPALCAQVTPSEAETLARNGIVKAEALQQHINLWPLKVALIEALNRSARAHEAAPIALELLERFATEPSVCWYPAEMWRRTYECLNASGQRVPAREALSRGVRWIHDVGLANLPAMWHEGFKLRQLTNVALLAAAAREGVA